MRSRATLFLAITIGIATAIVITANLWGGKSATTKAFQQKAARQDLPGTIDGAANPSAISDRVAYQMLFYSLYVRPRAGLEKRRALAAAASNNELNDTEIDALLAAAEEFQSRVSVLDRKAAEIKDRHWPNPSAEVMAQLTELQRRKEAIIDEIIDSLPNRLGADGAAKLHNHVNDRVKRKIKISPGRTSPPKRHH